MTKLEQLRKQKDEIQKLIREEVERLNKRYEPFKDRLDDLESDMAEDHAEQWDNECTRDNYYDMYKEMTVKELLEEYGCMYEFFEKNIEKLNKLKTDIAAHDLLLGEEKTALDGYSINSDLGSIKETRPGVDENDAVRSVA